MLQIAICGKLEDSMCTAAKPSVVRYYGERAQRGLCFHDNDVDPGEERAELNGQ